MQKIEEGAMDLKVPQEVDHTDDNIIELNNNAQRHIENDTGLCGNILTVDVHQTHQEEEISDEDLIT